MQIILYQIRKTCISVSRSRPENDGNMVGGIEFFTEISFEKASASKGKIKNETAGISDSCVA